MDKVWWNNISKAHKLLEDIVASVLAGKSIVLCLPQNIPWHGTLVELVRERLQMENPRNSFEEIKCPQEEIGLFLLNNYCKKEKRESYRYGHSYASFLGRSEDIVLNDRYIWVKEIPKAKYDEWIDFISEYIKNVTNKEPAVFILETQDESFAYKAKKGIGKIIFDKNIGSYDKFAFCALAATENTCRDYMRPYLAELVSTICNEDIELCARCMMEGMSFLEDPAGTIQKIAESNCRSDGEKYRFSWNEEKIKTQIWETQLKYIFPIIEKYRSYFITRYSSQLKKGLPIKNSFGEVVSNVQDVEIGTLAFMVGRGNVFIDAREYKDLEMFKIARNKLAHLNILDLAAVEDILEFKNQCGI